MVDRDLGTYVYNRIGTYWDPENDEFMDEHGSVVNMALPISQSLFVLPVYIVYYWRMLVTLTSLA